MKNWVEKCAEVSINCGNELRMPLPRYYYGVAPDVTVQTRVFVEWLFARIAQDEHTPAGF